jgi:hypothetical protein
MQGFGRVDTSPLLRGFGYFYQPSITVGIRAPKIFFKMASLKSLFSEFRQIRIWISSPAMEGATIGTHANAEYRNKHMSGQFINGEDSGRTWFHKFCTKFRWQIKSVFALDSISYREFDVYWVDNVVWSPKTHHSPSTLYFSRFIDDVDMRLQQFERLAWRACLRNGMHSNSHPIALGGHRKEHTSPKQMHSHRSWQSPRFFQSLV